jgi:site-specific recombinase XerD
MKQKYLFQNNKGELIDNSQFTRQWNKYKELAGIDCTPHQLRHSYATILFDAGVDVKTAQAWLGHADINTTLAIYTHLSEQKQKEAKEKLYKHLTTF